MKSRSACATASKYAPLLPIGEVGSRTRNFFNADLEFQGHHEETNSTKKASRLTDHDIQEAAEGQAQSTSHPRTVSK